MTPKLFLQAITKFVLGLLMIGLLLVLASPWSFVIMLLYIPIIALRIRNEEQVLERELKGYIEYKQRVRYKVMPFIW